MRASIFLYCFLVACFFSIQNLFAYDIQFRGVKGETYKPVPVQYVRVETIQNYVPVPGDKEVGTLILLFEPGEIGHNSQTLLNIAAEEAGAIGATIAYQKSVLFDPASDQISQAIFLCIRKTAPSRKKKHSTSK